MKPWPQIDFQRLVEEVCQPQVGGDHLTILGGVCCENDLPDFLQRWDLGGMPYRIWESVSEIVFEKDTLPQNVALLERGRLFGPGGDLELRRDGQTFIWRFIGPAGAQTPPEDEHTRNYWEDHPQVTFHQREETALLWGRWNGETWTDDRVGAARLNYPHPPAERVQIHYRTYSRAGRVEFVWLTGLSEWKEANHD